MLSKSHLCTKSHFSTDLTKTPLFCSLRSPWPSFFHTLAPLILLWSSLAAHPAHSKTCIHVCIRSCKSRCAASTSSLPSLTIYSWTSRNCQVGLLVYTLKSLSLQLNLAMLLWRRVSGSEFLSKSLGWPSLHKCHFPRGNWWRYAGLFSTSDLLHSRENKSLYLWKKKKSMWTHYKCAVSELIFRSWLKHQGFFFLVKYCFLFSISNMPMIWLTENQRRQLLLAWKFSWNTTSFLLTKTFVRQSISWISQKEYYYVSKQKLRLPTAHLL